MTPCSTSWCLSNSQIKPRRSRKRNKRKKEKINIKMWCARFKSGNLSEKKQMKNKTKTFPLMRSHGGSACAVDSPVDFAECFTLKLECFPPCLFCRETLRCKWGKRATPLLMRTTFYIVSGVAWGPDRLEPETILFCRLFKCNFFSSDSKQRVPAGWPPLNAQMLRKIMHKQPNYFFQSLFQRRPGPIAALRR